MSAVTRSIVVLLAVLLVLVGCSSGVATPAPTDTVVDTTVELTTALQGQEMVVQAGEPFTDYLFNGVGELLIVNGQEVRVWQFDTVAAADEAREFIASTSSPLATMRFANTPHFFQSGSMLVFFVDTDPAITNALTNILGQPFL